MVGRKPWSLKMRRKQSQRRASRSHKQQKPQPPPHGNAAELRAARLWTWVLQLTTLETRAQRRRYAHKRSWLSKCGRYKFIFSYMCSTPVSICFSHQSSGRQSSSSGLADLLVIDSSSNQSATTGNNCPTDGDEEKRMVVNVWFLKHGSVVDE